MAYAFVQEAHELSYTSAGQPTLTTGSSVTQGDLLIAYVTSSTPTYQTISDSINSWVPMVALQAGGYGVISAWYCIAKRTGVLSVQFFDANTVPSGGFVGVPANLNNVGAQIAEFSGNSISPLDAFSILTGTGISPAASVATNNANELVVGMVIPGATSDSNIPGSGWTAAAAVGNSLIYGTQSAVGVYAPTFAQSPTGTWCVIAASFKPSAADTGSITGSLGTAGAGAIVLFSSVTTKFTLSATANGSGNYTSPALSADSFVVQPQLLGQLFTPQQATIAPSSGGGNLLGSVSAVYPATGTLNTLGATLLVAVLWDFSTATLPTISDSAGNTWNYLTAYGTLTGTNSRTRIAYTYAKSGSALATSSADVFTITAASSTSASGVVYAFSGTLTSSAIYNAIQNGNSNYNSTSTQPGSITPNIGALIITGITTQSASLTPASINDGFSTPVTNSNETAVAAYLLNASGSALNPTWTFGGGPASAAIAAFNTQNTPVAGTQNFTAAAVNTNLVLTTLATDTFNRANESPLSNGGKWVADGTPIPPYDYPLAIVSDECVMSNTTIISNYAGPWSSDGISTYTGVTPSASQFATIEIDAMSFAPLSYSSMNINLMVPASVADGSFMSITNNGNGTATVVCFGVNESGGVVPTQGFVALRQSILPFFLYLPAVPFSLGDKFTFAVLGTTYFVMHNGVIVGQYTDATAHGSTYTGLEIVGNAPQNSVELSNFVTGNVSQGYSISGSVGVAGVTVSYTGTSSGSVVSGVGGAYTIPNLANGTYTITPTLAGYTFSPTNAPVTVLNANVTQNFTAASSGGSSNLLLAKNLLQVPNAIQGTNALLTPNLLGGTNDWS